MALNTGRGSLFRKVWIGLAGGVVTLLGAVALVGPGPGWLIVFFGLGILASEFAWAAQALAKAKGLAAWATRGRRLSRARSYLIAAGLVLSIIIALIVWLQIRG